MSPTRMSPPLRPDRVYEGMIPAPEAQRVQVVLDVPPVKVAPVREDAPAEPVQPSATAEACPSEWQDTWLWEMCQEEARRPA